MSTSPLALIASMADVKRVADYLGSHWFDAGTMKFFGTRLDPQTFRALTPNGSVGVFVTSDETYDGERMYSIRGYYVTRSEDGRDHFTDESIAFVRYETLSEASREAARLTLTDLLALPYAPALEALSPLTTGDTK